MLDYYYIDLYFDPQRFRLGQIVESCVSSLSEAGCTLNKVTMASGDAASGYISLTEHIDISIKDLPAFSDTYLEDMRQEGNDLISFPPQGRVIFTYPFDFDDWMMDEIHEEEDDTNSKCEDIGLTFMYTVTEEGGHKIKASLTFWEEYVLTHGSPDIQAGNMRKILGFIKGIVRKTPPYFGATNTELHLNTDSSLKLLKQGKLPEGNEYAIVGGSMIDKLNLSELRDKGFMYEPLADGGLIIQMVNKWSGITAL